MNDTSDLPSIGEYLSTAVVLVDSRLRARYINPAAEALFGISARQLQNQPLRNLAAGLVDLEPGLRQALELDEPYRERERKVLTHALQSITVDVSVTPVPGPYLLLELVQLDRHLRISREQQLIAQHRAVSELVRGLAHEIKNPLGGLRGAAQLLERQFQMPELREYTQVIIGEADRLRGLVDALLGPSGRPQPRRINIHEVVERVRQLVQAEAPAGVEIVRDYDPSIPQLTAEPDQLIQALLNLVRNALQAVGEQGRIVLRTRTQRLATIGDVTHRLAVRIDVVDNGPGVPPEMIDQIFLPTVTSRHDGSGLGLSIAQTLVTRHGGLIECVSEPGHTEFTILLPLEKDHD